ncbi:hypothetical protein ACO2I3_08875 [Leptospira interrogans]
MGGYETDTEFSLNAISPIALRLESCEIEIDPRKFEYLSREKAKSLQGLGLLDSHMDQLKVMVEAYQWQLHLQHDPRRHPRRQPLQHHDRSEASGYGAVVSSDGGLGIQEERRLRLITLM